MPRNSAALLVVGLAFLPSLSHAQALGPESGTDDPIWTAALGTQWEFSIAYGAGEYLAAWVDSPDINLAPSSVYAARFDANGTLMDDPPIVLAQGPTLRGAAVGFDGKSFLVAWLYPGMGTLSTDIHGAWIGTDGKVDPNSPFDIAKATNIQSDVALAGGVDGGGKGHMLAVWTDQFSVSGAAIRGTLFDDTRAIVQPTPNCVGMKGPCGFPIAPNIGGGDGNTAAVTWDGTGFMVAWSQNPQLGFRMIAAASVGLDASVTAPVQLSVGLGDPNSPTVAYDPVKKNYLVAYSDLRDDHVNRHIYGTLLPYGFSMAPNDQELVPPETLGDQLLRAQAGSLGGRFLLVWESFHSLDSKISTLSGQRFDGDGNPLDGPNGQSLGTVPASLPVGRRSTIATDGQTMLLGWIQDDLQGTRSTVEDIHVMSLDLTKTLTPGASIEPARDWNYQRSHAVASNGTSFLVVWEDDRNYTTSGVDIYGLRYDLDGNPLDKMAIPICTAPGDQFLPAVSAQASGGKYLVAWADGRTVDRTNETGAVVIQGALVAQTGPADADFPIAASPGLARLAPALAASPGGWLVAWEDWNGAMANQNPLPDVVSTFVDTSGKVAPSTCCAGGITDSQPQRPITASGGDANSTACAPSVAWNGKEFLVAFETPCTLEDVPMLGYGSAVGDVKGAWVDPTGCPPPTGNCPNSGAGSFAIANAQDVGDTAPQVAAIGSQVVVAWKCLGKLEQICAALVDDGAQSAKGQQEYSSGNGHRYAPSVGAEPDGASGVLISWLDTTPVGVYAVHTDVALMPIGPIFPVTTDPPYVVLPAKATNIFYPSDVDGAQIAAHARQSPAGGVAVMKGGSALVTYDIEVSDAIHSVERLHLREIGIGARGTNCSSGSQCADGFCTARGICCNAPCDGVCQTCTAEGCIGTPSSDDRCGVGDAGELSCATLATTCRKYDEITAHACAAFGQCAAPGSLAECTSWTAINEGNPCDDFACAGMAGTCKQGTCDCKIPDSKEFVARVVPGCACAVGARPAPGGFALALLLVGLALATSKYSRRR
jgi:MYXO-CTERM domain-containing protein